MVDQILVVLDRLFVLAYELKVIRQSLASHAADFSTAAVDHGLKHFLTFIRITVPQFIESEMKAGILPLETAAILLGNRLERLLGLHLLLDRCCKGDPAGHIVQRHLAVVVVHRCLESQARLFILIHPVTVETDSTDNKKHDRHGGCDDRVAVSCEESDGLADFLDKTVFLELFPGQLSQG